MMVILSAIFFNFAKPDQIWIEKTVCRIVFNIIVMVYISFLIFDIEMLFFDDLLDWNLITLIV